MNLLELLSIETGTPIPTLERIIASAPKRYKVYQIPKRSGGLRTIAHPAKELKAIQRVVLARVLNQAPISDIAMAYVSGRGIVQNAQNHVGQRWLLKLDFRQFFPSLTPRDWDRAIRRTPSMQGCAKDQALYHNVLFWGAGGPKPFCLSIGAPTSPATSNFLCFKLDQWMIERATKSGLVVTRYADDITVSGQNRRGLEAFERSLLLAMERNKGIQFKMNEEKRGLYGPGERRMVTGLILTPDGKVSLGRERKREISALIHKFKVGEISDEATLRVKGLLGFAKSAEPGFFESISNKYGMELVYQIQRYESQFTDLIESDFDELPPVWFPFFE